MLTHLTVNKNKPVVFLDLCGVVGDIWLVREGMRELPYSDSYVIEHPHFGKGDVMYKPIVDVLIAIFRKFDVQVIVVSSWVGSFVDHNHPDIIALREMMGYDNILGSLATSGGPERGTRVKAFIEHHQLTHWVVIDDSYRQMYLDKAFFNDQYVVAPHGRHGLGGVEFEKLHTLLNYTPIQRTVANVINILIGVYEKYYSTISSDGMVLMDMVSDDVEVWLAETNHCIPLFVRWMNSGDCAILALLAGDVLDTMGYSVKYHRNGIHAFFSIEGVYFDTMFPYGVKDDKQLLNDPERYSLDTGDREWFCHSRVSDNDTAIIREIFEREVGITTHFPHYGLGAGNEPPITLREFVTEIDPKM